MAIIEPTHRPIRVASDETRLRILADPEVTQGLQNYLTRYREYGGDPPVISGEEFRRRLGDT